MTLKNGDRFTIYDAMEASGYFTRNPANANARDDQGRQLYGGPVKFPMMLYDPEGREVVIVPGQKERTPWGTVEVFGEQRALITREVNSEEDLASALAEGWHKHPAHALRAGNEGWRKAQGVPPVPIPTISAASRITELEEQNRRLTELLEQAKKDQDELDEHAATFTKPPNGVSAVARAGLV